MVLLNLITRLVPVAVAVVAYCTGNEYKTPPDDLKPCGDGLSQDHIIS